MKVAVVGATGLVGTRMLELLEERNFPVDELLPVASEKSVGKKVPFRGREWTVMSASDAIAARPQLALFSAGGGTSAELAPKFAEVGCRVVDNSSFWRMDPTKKLVVPEINGDVLTADDWIIANPNCSTIQMVLPLAPVHRELGIKRIVVSTYQSVTGTGYKAIAQMNTERGLAEQERAKLAGASGSSGSGSASGSAGLLASATALPYWGSYPAIYPYPIDQNILPHIDSFLENGYTKEEMKMTNETKKILRDDSIAVTATTVRVPVQGGHSESINVETLRPFTVEQVRELMASQPGVTVQDDPSRNVYPMPIYAWGRNDVFVGRIRRDFTVENGFNFWCVSDNIRKGAATNAVQIAELLLKKGLI
ncbi:MAG: aspartate-semialdehyde dehydrogenase [Bacteroidales bacterium]|nr:aspartate-semialdehyde dehydrogenase [Bacteroidales bacterium]